ncbi:MAG: substrate-binding domain-containing protein [Bacillota bacterium]
MKWLRQLAALVATAALLSGCGAGSTPGSSDRTVILATTTSTQDSGLLDVLLPLFEKQSGYQVKPIAVGTGQALVMGERGEADLLLVHAPASERVLVEKGVAVNRRLVMHNDFVIVGPPGDPAGVKGVRTGAEALARIAQAGAPFFSRGDNSGTHQKELALWKATGLTPEGRWYQQTGSGMGQTLNVASEKGGYALTDRATFLSLRKHLKLELVLEGDAPLLNIYHVMQVNPARFDRVNAEGAKALADFFLSPEAQEAIGRFGVDRYGQPLFFPDGGKQESDLAGG